MDIKPDLAPHTRAWKRNLTFVWLSQFLSLVGFCFVMPFAPLYIQELGISETDSRFWAGIFGAAAPLTLAIAAPFWGKLADRYGRKLMLLRANIGGAIMLFAMGQVHAVEMLIVLRLVQGFFTGTVPAAQTLVAVSTPDRRQGMALGSLMGAVFSGQFAGSALGGYCAEALGYRKCFEIAGVIMLLAGILAMRVDEKFLRPERVKSKERLTKRIFRLPHLGTALPILFLMFFMAMAIRFDRSFLSLFVQEIHGKIEGAAALTGQLEAFGAISSMLAAFLMGLLLDRYSPSVLGICAALGSAIFMFSQGFASSFTFLFGARIAMLFCAGGFHPIFTVWLVRNTPSKKRGSILGWATSFRAIGWMAASLFGTVVATQMGLRSIFFVASVLLILLIPFTAWVTRKDNNNNIDKN